MHSNHAARSGFAGRLHSLQGPKSIWLGGLCETGCKAPLGSLSGARQHSTNVVEGACVG